MWYTRSNANASDGMGRCWMNLRTVSLKQLLDGLHLAKVSGRGRYKTTSQKDCHGGDGGLLSKSLTWDKTQQVAKDRTKCKATITAVNVPCTEMKTIK